MDGFILTAVAILALMTGFWVGRAIRWQLAEQEEDEGEETRQESETERPARSLSDKILEYFSMRRKGKEANLRRISLGKEIASPTAGEMSVSMENGRRVVRIRPKEGKLYAPASGKIVRLYPMGCAMILRTEFGAEILLRAGEDADEMCSMYYRCRVMEREVVKKGSLLLEFDIEGLCSEGVDTEVTMILEEHVPECEAAGRRPQIKVGETICVGASE